MKRLPANEKPTTKEEVITNLEKRIDCKILSCFTGGQTSEGSKTFGLSEQCFVYAAWPSKNIQRTLKQMYRTAGWQLTFNYDAGGEQGFFVEPIYRRGDKK